MLWIAPEPSFELWLSCIFYSLQDILYYYQCPLVQTSVLHHLWDSSKIVSYCYRSCWACSMQAMSHTVAAVFCAAD